MTAPPRHESALSRRAVRAQRERGLLRAPEPATPPPEVASAPADARPILRASAKARPPAPSAPAEARPTALRASGEARPTALRARADSRRAAQRAEQDAREAAAEARATADTVPIRIVRAPAPPPPVAEASPAAPVAELAPALPVIHLAPANLDPPPLPHAPAAPDVSERVEPWPPGEPPVLRRSRSGQLLDTGVLPRSAPVRHARVGLLARVVTAAGFVAGAALIVTSVSAVTSALAPAPTVAVAAQASTDAPDALVPPEPRETDAASAALGAIAVQPQTAQVDPALIDLCADPGFAAALAAGDDSATIAAAGGAVPFRDAVAAGRASCVSLEDPARVWVVVDKLRPFAPIDFSPGPLDAPAGVRNPDGGVLQAHAAAALSAMAEASRVAGAGEIAVVSAYRSYATQVDTYNGHVADRGVEGADLVSARPGFSEHQSGLAADVAPCDGACLSIDDLAASPQGAWILEHAWEYGWIVRYEDGSTPATGYLAEPWHLRYIGTDLARAYHEGRWSTLEEFFGLPPAPDYAH